LLVGKFVAADEGVIELQITPYDGPQLLPGAQTLRLPLDKAGEMQTHLACFSRGDETLIGYGRLLLRRRGRQTLAEMPSAIHSITGSLPHTRTRIVVGCQHGGVLVWGDERDAAQFPFAGDLFQPCVGINRGGWIAAATRDVVQIYGTHEGKLSFIAELSGPNADPIVVLSTDHARRIAVATDDGKVVIYEVPT
jgi:hypothetical protein